ncbi:threonine--tRNA ligase [Candidatus Ichthyocystis hellenicum]|uniref:threonine--tRNA ligase n=1 Tax=Candidatus Ichthyocystis hellenicum TaxID=1561003 RepID=UPI000A4830C8|nr:threonine--tRNA ligase [Candidatus Ichthyocystis hellenicum]
MVHITFPDGSVRGYEEAVTAFSVAFDISPKLAKCSVAAFVNGSLVDIYHPIREDAQLRIVRDCDPEAVAVIRHSCAHLLAHAVKEIFPESQVAIGPVVENGFYYDFSLPRPLNDDDLPVIENKMRDIASRNLNIERFVLSRQEAMDFFLNLGEKYKVEVISSIPEGESLSLYRQGEFVDLCRGPHVPNTSFIKVFRLMRVAGAYWRGDSKNEMLQRIYGTAFFKSQDLDKHLSFIEEAEKRDHRRIGKRLNFFHWQDEAPGMVFWHPRGWTVWQIIEGYLRNILAKSGYQEVKTPQLMSRSLWVRSGHWDNYSEHMFITESEKHDYAIKPMNCPGHVQIFNTVLRSYRDLPLRLSEFGSCHRNEPSGALHGLMRVRAFVQDDAHIFCTEDQIIDEVVAFNRLLLGVYLDFGFNDVVIKLSLRPEKRIGSDSVWDHAENSLRDALRLGSLSWEELPGEGAFYGPKIEFHVKDAIGRSWQCGTLQLDFSLPGRLGAEYVSEGNERLCPVMIHRAILGSIERFIGIIIEHYSGSLPLWLSPVQLCVLTVTQRCDNYADEVAMLLDRDGFRVEKDLRKETIGYKIREHAMLRVPYLVIIGDKEQSEGLVSVRSRLGEDLGQMSLADLIERLKSDVVNRL